MPSPFVSRRLYDDVLADCARLREERNQFAKDRDAQREAAETAARQLAEVATDDTRRQAVALALGAPTDASWAHLITEARRAHETRTRLIRETDSMRVRLAAAEAQAALAGPTIDGAPLHRVEANSVRVRRFKEQARKLDEQRSELIRINDDLNRELYDRAAAAEGSAS